MSRTIILYGLSLAVLVIVLKAIEYRYMVHDLSLEFYVGIVAVFFTAIGIWGGLRLTSSKMVLVNPSFTRDQSALQRLGISPREFEVLELISKGLSNQEIADKLFVSLNTVKTHASNLFTKLDAKRRTQALQKAKELQLIP